MNPKRTRFKRRKAPPDGAYPCASKNRVIWLFGYRTTGVYMVELLVALVLGTMFTMALVSTMGTTFRLASATQNDVYADNVLSQLREFSRSVNYQFLEDRKGTHILLQNGNKLTNMVLQDAFQWDESKLWYDTTAKIYFPGTVTYKVEDGAEVGQSLKITITASWVDSGRQIEKQLHSITTVFKEVQRIDSASL